MKPCPSCKIIRKPKIKKKYKHSKMYMIEKNDFLLRKKNNKNKLTKTKKKKHLNINLK